MPYVLRNISRGSELATDVHLALSVAERTRGLLDWSEIREGQALIISPCNSVHMFGMRFAIDVLFLDKAGVVVRAIEGLKPWRFTRLHFRARHTVELPPGAIARSGTQRGDKIELPEGL